MVNHSSNDLSGTATGPVVQAGHVGQVTFGGPATPTPTALAGLPPVSDEFTGRDEALVTLADPLRPGSAVPVSVLSGTAGVGKTALALRAAHGALAAGWFPGGVLFVDLQGYDEGRFIRPDDAVSTFLSALGVPDELFPPKFAARLALYRSRLAERDATLVVFDNASSADQVRPLLPASSVHRVLVTSRHTLGDLGGSRIMDLGVLEPEEAAAFIARTLRVRRPDDTRAGEEPGAVRELAALCGHLPLAVAIVASILAGDPEQPVAELTAALRDRATRLAELSYGGVNPVTAAFELSYARLAPDEARMFRLLSLNPGQQVSTAAAAALADVPLHRARRLLGALRTANMIEPAKPRGWFRFHDLLRLFAEERMRERPDEGALDRLLTHYRDAAAEANERISHGGDPEAEAWLDTERTNLVDAVRLAYTSGLHAVAHPLGIDVSWFLRRRQDWHDGLRMCHMATESAHGETERARALYNFGDFLKNMGDLAGARLRLGEALPLFRALGDRAGEARTLHSLGTVTRRGDDFAAAEEHYLAALPIFRELGDPKGAGGTLQNLAETARGRGNAELAEERLVAALKVFQGLGDAHAEGRVLRRLGRHAEALPAFERAGCAACADEVRALLR